MELKNIVKALQGGQSLLLVLPKEVGATLGIADQDWLRYEVKYGEIVIKKIKAGEII
jgi:bifunctional DNA-binding transcriptional regulator/antitoxin component of YhaV-PrlF toxin-antitoxin module